MIIRIATYNIHKGVSSFGSRPRIHALKQALSSMSADIVFLQEVQGRHDLLALRHATHWPLQSQHEFLAGDKHCVYGMNAVYDHGRMVALLSLASYQCGWPQSHDRGRGQMQMIANIYVYAMTGEPENATPPTASAATVR